MGLLSYMLFKCVISFLPKSKCLNFRLQSPSAVILEPKKIKSVNICIVSPSIFHEVMGPNAMILVFWMLSFKSACSLTSYTFNQRLFSSSSISAISLVSYVYLRLLLFLTILIPVCASSSPALHMMYSAYKLNKQDDNIQPWCTPFIAWNQSIIPWFHVCSKCCVLTCIQISEEAVKVVWYFHLLKICHSLLWSSHKGLLCSQKFARIPI